MINLEDAPCGAVEYTITVVSITVTISTSEAGLNNRNYSLLYIIHKVLLSQSATIITI